ncbi:MAG: hypothetical protein Q9211_006815, partial [Gyalolechia sp. 1 TL-2023]
PFTRSIPLGIKSAHPNNKPSRLLNLPPEIRLQIYSYLLPNVHSYTNGISDPVAVLRPSLRSDSEPSYPEILFTCRQIYHEALSILYHGRCFNFDIAGHVLRSVANRRNRITALDFATWLGLSSYFKQHWPAYEIEQLDYTSMEEVCITFWPVNGDAVKLEDARLVATDLCRQLRKAERLKKVSINFLDAWQAEAVSMSCGDVNEKEYLLQPLKTLRGVEEVEIQMPAYCMVGRESVQSGRMPRTEEVDTSHAIDEQMRCIEEIKRSITEKAQVDIRIHLQQHHNSILLSDVKESLSFISALKTSFTSINLGIDWLHNSQYCVAKTKDRALARRFVVDPARPTGQEFEIVVAHYNEDLSWLKQYSSECCVYSKGGSKNTPELPFTPTPLPNIGREGHTFLQHIVHHYDKLADVTLFVQGRIDDHVNLTLNEIKKRALETIPGQVKTFPFRELELFDHWDGIPWEEYPCWKRWSSMDMQKMKDTPLQLFQKYITESDRVPVAVGFAPGAIFAVRKETICSHGKAYYQRLLEKLFLGDMAHVNPETGHYMERFWLAMFNPDEYIQWSVDDLADAERNEDGQLAKAKWYRTPTGSAIDLGAIRRGEGIDSPLTPLTPFTRSSVSPSTPETALSMMTDEEGVKEP